MKIGILSDAHGNLIGLKKCIDFLRTQEVDEIFYLGDMVGYMLDAQEVVEAVRDNCQVIISGNHEAMLLGDLNYNEDREPYYQLLKTKQILSLENLSFLKTLEPKKELTIDGKKLLMVHGNPQDPIKGYLYPDTEIESNDVKGYDAVFMGHTHRPFIKHVENTVVTNVGSCGLPRDYGGLAACAVYNSADNTAEVFRIPLTFEEISTRYGDKIHPDVLKVFKRTCDNIVGTQI